jgi:hypothetical protein
MTLSKTPLALALPVLFAACASAPPAAPVDVPPALRARADEALVAAVEAKGVQIYECRVRKDQPGIAEWAFVAPEAELFDAQGKKAGTHGTGPFWQANDGSRVVGRVKARAAAPDAGSIPWLLLETTPTPGAASGVFSKISSIQRVNTVGGEAPPSGCTVASLGKVERVGYTADYLLFTPK